MGQPTVKKPNEHGAAVHLFLKDFLIQKSCQEGKGRFGFFIWSETLSEFVRKGTVQETTKSTILVLGWSCDGADLHDPAIVSLAIGNLISA